MIKKSIWYTYKLIDPSNNSVFYIGKGKGSRIDAHEKEALKGVCSNKCKKIRELISKYGKIDKQIIAYFWDEQAAYDHETDIIEEIGLKNLTNVLPGGQKAWAKRLTERKSRNQFNPIDGLLFNPAYTALWINSIKNNEKIEVKNSGILKYIVEAYFESFLPMCLEKLNKNEENINLINARLSRYGAVIT